jgi:Spherulation-specific family 4
MVAGLLGQAPRGRLGRIAAVTAVALAAVGVYGRAALSAQPASHLRLGVPAYVYPGQAPLAALRAISPAPGVVILNPANGDGPFDSQWQVVADQLRARGITVLGYVHTNQGTRPFADAQASIDNYLASTAGRPHVSGIFLDELPSSCSFVPYYVSLRQYIRHADPAAFVAANPGAPVSSCYLRPRGQVAQAFVTFEHDASTYQAGYRGNVVWPAGRVTGGWIFPAAEFWHLVYAASRSQMPRIVALAAARHAATAYVTDGDLPNPWNSVPPYLPAQARLMARTVTR